MLTSVIIMAEENPHEENGEEEIEEIRRRLGRAQKELEKIEETGANIVGIERISMELRKLQGELQAFSFSKEKKRFWGALAVIVFLGIILIPSTWIPGLSVVGQRTLAIFALVIVLWLSEALPLPATALAPGILLYLLGVVPSPSEAFKTYAHPAVFFIIGSLLIAYGLMDSGLGKRFAVSLLSKCKRSPTLLLFLIIVVSATLAAFISDHLVAAMLIPVVTTIIIVSEIKGDFKTALVLAVAFGAGIAGLATPSGGARNVVVIGLLQEITGAQITYLEWIVAALPLTLMLIPVIFVSLRLLFPPPKDIDFTKTVEKLSSELGPMGRKEWGALGVFLLTITLFITTSNLIGLGTVALIGAVLMFFVGGADWSEVEKRVPWGVMFIYGAAVTLGITLKDTGAAQWLAKGLMGVIPHHSPLILIGGVVVLATVVTAVMSDGAAASVLAPITLNVAILADMDPRIMALVTAIPCAFAYVTIFGTPPNTIAYSSGYFDSKQLLKGGIILQICAMVFIFILAKYYWTWLGIW